MCYIRWERKTLEEFSEERRCMKEENKSGINFPLQTTRDYISNQDSERKMAGTSRTMADSRRVKTVPTRDQPKKGRKERQRKRFLEINNEDLGKIGTED